MRHFKPVLLLLLLLLYIPALLLAPKTLCCDPAPGDCTPGPPCQAACLSLPPAPSVSLLARWQKSSSNGLQLPSSQMALVSEAGGGPGSSALPERRTASFFPSALSPPRGWIMNSGTPLWTQFNTWPNIILTRELAPGGRALPQL